MRYKRAQDSDIPQLCVIWKQAFGDTDAQIDDFFRIAYPACIPFAAYDGTRVAGMLFALPQAIFCGETRRAGAYLFAVATDEAYRRQGICRALIAHAESVLRRKNFACTFLVPGDDGLAAMYERLGYRGAARGETVLDAPAAAGAAEAVDATAYAGLRETLLYDTPHVRYEKVWLDYEAADAEFFVLHLGGGLGCAAVSRQPDGGVRIDELLPDARFLPALHQTMQAARYTMPECNEPMVKWLDEKAAVWPAFRIGFDFA